MLVFVTKASDDYWYDFREVNTLDDLMEIHDYVIVEKNNNLYPRAFDFWEGFKEEDIPKAISAKYHVTIYDDYVE